ncbi:MAG: hypothetical protein WC915_03175 [archaeon]|jgi:hypothetical protein
MDINTDAQEIVTNSFISWVKNKKLQKYFVILAILEVIFAVILMSILNESISNFAQLNETQIELAITTIISFYGSMMLFLIPFSLIVTFFSYKIIQEGLKLSKRKSIQLTFLRYLKFLLYPWFAFLAALFSIFDIRYLAIGIIGGLIFIIGGLTFLTNPALGIPIMILGFLLIFVYLIIVLINSIKLVLGQIIYVEKERTIFESLKESFIVTNGNVVNLILLGLILGIIVSLISGLVSLPSTIYVQMLIESNPNPTFIFMDLIYQLLLIPAYIVAGYTIICGNLFTINIYSKIKSKN